MNARNSDEICICACLQRKRRDLLGTLISDLVLMILSYVAETKRTFIKARQAEGIAAMQRLGVRFGRPRMKLPANFFAEKARYKSKEITLAQAASNCRMSRTTFWERTREMESASKRLPFRSA